MSGKKPKSVSFNEKNEREKEIMDWIDEEGLSFAPFVKDLLYEAMRRRKDGLRIIQRNKKGGVTIIVGNTPPPSKASV